VPEDGDPRKLLAEGAKAVREKAESPLAIPLTQLGSGLGGMSSGVKGVLEKSYDNGKLLAQLGFFKVREQFIQTPEQKLGAHAALLQDRNRKDPKELDAILRETDWLLSPEAKASPDTRGKALYVSGLALRNQQKFAEARQALGEAAKLAGPKSTWGASAKKALQELTDPKAYYLPQIAKLQSEGNFKGAFAEANTALKAMPSNGKIYAERGLVRLAMAKGIKDGMVGAKKLVRDDAEAAIKNNSAAEGHYVEGLLEEELGQFGKAEAAFRDAIKSHKGTDGDASRYRIALARVLLKASAAAPAVDAPAPADKKGEPQSSNTPPAPYVHPVTALLLTVTISAQPEGEPEAEVENAQTAKRVRESVDLALKVLATAKDQSERAKAYEILSKAAEQAGSKLTSTTCRELSDQLLTSKDAKVRATGMLLKGHALVKTGRRTEGLKEYSKGLETLNPGLESKEIVKMVEEHPAFQHPDAANKPNPVLAEKHFAFGLQHYWSKRYPEAEAQFKQALDFYNQDARYSYFLGLAQLAQKTKLKRDQGLFSLEKGAQLEAVGRPSITEINLSLERVQGDLRQLVNSYRVKGPAGAP
jgi:TolA-binding protein